MYANQTCTNDAVPKEARHLPFIYTIIITQTMKNTLKLLFAVLFVAMVLPVKAQVNEIKQFAKEISEAAVFGSNMRASAEYRKLLTEVLVGRAVEDICLQLKGDTQEGLKR